MVTEWILQVSARKLGSSNTLSIFVYFLKFYDDSFDNFRIVMELKIRVG